MTVGDGECSARAVPEGPAASLNAYPAMGGTTAGEKTRWHKLERLADTVERARA